MNYIECFTKLAVAISLFLCFLTNEEITVFFCNKILSLILAAELRLSIYCKKEKSFFSTIFSHKFIKELLLLNSKFTIKIRVNLQKILGKFTIENP